MDRQEAIGRLRAYMEEEDISAMIVPSNDPHFGEYIPDYYNCRAMLSGFRGSCGTLVISMTKAALWTDSRYFIQAAKDLAGSEIELMKMKMEGTPTIAQWLKSHLDDDAIVAMDEDLYSYQDYQALVDELSPLTPALIEDPFDEIWTDRPPLEFFPIRLMPEEISGESISSKHKRLCDKLRSDIPFAYIVTALDEIAWLCNLRGSDVTYNPLFLSYAIVTEENITLFLRQQFLSQEAMHYLCEQGVVLEDYEDFTAHLRKLPKECIRIFSANRITAKNFFAAMENIYQPAVFPPYIPDPTLGGTLAYMKAIKNQTEIEGYKKANEEDAKAWKKVVEWIHENKDKGITEYDVSQKLIECRSECPDYLGESFEAIVGYGANAALPHYCAHTPEEAAVIKPEGMLLIDTGGQYTYGTTDTTRTIPLGPLTQQQKDDYTSALKGTIDMAMAVFPKGMRGCLLDIYARGPIMAAGKMYWHGTCHGIGHNLCVHEGPQSIRMEENPVPLACNMVMSDEPALYVEGQYGIRHENTILSVPYVSNEFGEFYRFETITRVPIDTTPVNYAMLNEEEKKWLEKFNADCI